MPEVRLIGEQAADVVIFIGDDPALEHAVFLTRFADSVTLFHRRDSLCRSKIMQCCLGTNLKIVPRWNGEISEATGDDSVTGLSLGITITPTEFTLDATGLFTATGLFFTVGRGPRSVLVA